MFTRNARDRSRRKPILWLILALFALAETSSGQDDLGARLPRIKPRDPAQALDSFRPHEGFRLKLLASEPLVTNPVAVCYDADLRLYVAEMRGYPFAEQVPSGGIARLEDRDGDGRFDHRTSFLPGLSWPTSVVPYDDGVFVASAPDILYAKDTNGDGVADVRKVIFTGFGINNVQGLLNGLLWGPDGWIYGVASSNGGIVKNLIHPVRPPVDTRGRDFRFRPDGSAFETVSGGGQFGHSFDDWGHRFTCSNSNHARQIVLSLADLERGPALANSPVSVDIAAEGPAAPVFRISEPEPWRIIRTRQRAADPVMAQRLPPTELVATGFFTSATGITVYRGTAYPAEYRGNLFVGDVGGNLVHRKRLEPAAAIYKATRADQGREFLASTDNWFRPVNFAETPDGSLLVIDMYRETIEHPASIPEPIKRHLDLKSGLDRGRIYELVSEGSRRPRRSSLARMSTIDLVNLLADADPWPRETARRLLIERGDPAAIEPLEHLARSRPTALGRLNALWTLSALGKLDGAMVLSGLADVEPRVRERVVRLARPFLKQDQAVLDRIIDLASDPDPMTRLEVALALGDAAARPAVVKGLATIAARDADNPWIRASVMSSLGGHPESLAGELLREGFFTREVAGPWLDDLASLVGHQRDPDQALRLIQEVERARISSAGQARFVLALVRGWGRNGLGTLLSSKAGPAIQSVIEEAERTATGSGPLDERITAVRLVGLPASEHARTTLVKLVDPREPPALEIAALQALGGSVDRPMAVELVDRMKGLSPAVKREALEVLFSRRGSAVVVLEEVENGTLSASVIEPARWSALEARDKTLAQRVHKIRERSGTGNRREVIARYQKATTLPGDPTRGLVVFRKSCATCHLARGHGHDVGPDLATVAHRSPEDLVTHILDPNREVAANYLNYSITTLDGRVSTGIIAGESATAVTLKRAEGASEVVGRDQIDTIASSSLSLMPEGLEKDVDPQALADVVAFIRSILPGSPAK